jgi:hypothetical protein
MKWHKAVYIAGPRPISPPAVENPQLLIPVITWLIPGLIPDSPGPGPLKPRRFSPPAVVNPRLQIPSNSWLIPNHTPASPDPRPAGSCTVGLEEERNSAAFLWPSTALMICAACSRCAVHVSRAPHANKTFANATVGGTAKGP